MSQTGSVQEMADKALPVDWILQVAELKSLYT